MFPETDTSGTKYKWTVIKPGGVHFQPRCGMPVTQAPNNNAYVFGGVFDLEDTEEDISGNFFNDLHCFDLEKLCWWQIVPTGKRDKTKKKKDEKTKDDENQEVEEMEIETPQVVADDGIFTVTIGPSTAANAVPTNNDSGDVKKVFQPSSRMNCGLAVKHGTLYLYGGMIEEGSKQFTLADFYSLGKSLTNQNYLA